MQVWQARMVPPRAGPPELPLRDTGIEAHAPNLVQSESPRPYPVADELEAAIATWRTDEDRRRLRRELLRLVAGLDTRDCR